MQDAIARSEAARQAFNAQLAAAPEAEAGQAASMTGDLAWPAADGTACSSMHALQARADAFAGGAAAFLLCVQRCALRVSTLRWRATCL